MHWEMRFTWLVWLSVGYLFGAFFWSTFWWQCDDHAKTLRLLQITQSVTNRHKCSTFATTRVLKKRRRIKHCDKQRIPNCDTHLFLSSLLGCWLHRQEALECRWNHGIEAANGSNSYIKMGPTDSRIIPLATITTTESEDESLVHL